MLELQRQGGVAWLALDRPAKGNALSAELVERLIGTLDEVFADGASHTLVVTGRGPHLCTGFDLSALETESDGDLLQRIVRVEAMLQRVWHAPIRTVAVAHGRTTGAGADLFAACDERLVVDGAAFRFPGAGFGIVLGSARLAERVGVDRARRWLAASSLVGTREALDAGLATAMAPNDAAVAAPSGWLDAAGIATPTIELPTLARIRAATRTDHRDADLAALVRSASQPGLQGRIAAYRAASRPPPPSTPTRP